MEEDLRGLLLADAGVAAATGGRVTWGVRPQGSAFPAVVLYVVGSVPAYTLQEDTTRRDARVQADCMGATYAEANAVSRAVSAALSGYRGEYGSTIFQGIFLDSARDLSEPGATEQIYRVSLDFIVHHLPQE